MTPYSGIKRSIFSFLSKNIIGPKGFTLVELMITMVVIFILSSMALPLSRNMAKHAKESELKQKLTSIRKAIDDFHRDWNRDGDVLIGELCKKNKISCKEVTSPDGFPKTLEALLDVPLTGEVEKKSRKYLRQIWTDPMTESAKWGFRCYSDPPDSFTWCGDDIYDIYTTSLTTATDGSKYREW
jgi:general secretion pathway protein G